MPPKRRLVPPIKPNADGTGFVRAGRQAAAGQPASQRAGAPRRLAASSSSGSAATSSASTSSAASAGSRSSSSEAAASPSPAGQTRGRAGHPASDAHRCAPAKANPAAPRTSVDVPSALKPTAASPTHSARLKAPTPAAPSTSVSTAASPPAVRAAKAPASAPASVSDFQLGVDASLGASECMLTSRALQQLGLLSGSLVRLTTSYGEVYAEARHVRSAASDRRLLVSEDAAAVLVDKTVQLHPLEVPTHGIPLLTAVSVRPVKPEGESAASADDAVVASLVSSLDWQAMFRRALHHKLVYVHLRSTQRVLTHKLALEVVNVATAEDGRTDALTCSSSLSSTSAAWGLMTDATVVHLESGHGSLGAPPQVAPASDKDGALRQCAAAAGPRCTLVVGDSGTGKSRWLQQVGRGGQMPASQYERALHDASDSWRHVEWVRVEELPQGEGSEVSTATALHESFERARLSAPATVVLDDLHLVCAKEATAAGSRWAMALIARALADELLDVRQRGLDVWVVASAPAVDSLDGCLTTSSLFGQHVVTLEMPAGAADRLACLRTCIQEVGGGAAALEAIGERCLIEVAERAHGFTQRDLHRLVETAVVAAFQSRQSVRLQDGDLRAAAALVHPSSLKRFEVSVPNVSWADIGGSEEAKRTLCDVVEWCLGKQSWVFTEFNLTPPKGVLLYGPPGCSKTMLAKALANESHMNFISVKGPEVFSKWVGDSEKAVRDIFERARAASPCVVFIDELDGMCGHRGRGGVSDRVISQFLTELDGLPAAFEQRKNALVFVAATNRPDSIDGAVLRPGRIDRRVYVGLPSLSERVAIAEIQFRHLPVSPELSAVYVAERTEGYTGAEVVAVVKEAAFHAITADAKAACVTVADVDAALVKVRPRIQAKDVEWYKQWPHNTPVQAN